MHFPIRRNERGQGLAPSHAWPVYDASRYPDQVPPEWVEMATPQRGVYFFGVPPIEDGDRELWFDFCELNRLEHEYAVLILVQGLNAITGLPTDEGMAMGQYNGPGKAVLEQYNECCPAHGTPLGANRYCEQCGFEWPKQNYVTNAAGPGSVSQFWRDGWRKGDGRVYQFAIRPTEAGVGVAQQILKACRTLAIDIVVFRSKDPKPVPHRRPTVYRGIDPLEGYGLLGGGTKGIGSSMGDPDDDLGAESLEPVFLGGGPTRSAKPVIRRTMAHPASLERMEVAAGREVNQEVHPDPHELDFWESDPCAMFTIVPVDQDWVDQVISGGPTRRETPGGAFSGIATV